MSDLVMNRCQQVFRLTDEDKKGFLSAEDIKVAVMIMFGNKISKLEAVQLLTKYGSQLESGDLGLSLAQFETAVKEKFTVDLDEQIRHTFMLFDKKCRGFLTLDDIKSVFQQVCPCLPEHQLEMSFRELDRDGDGRVSYKDFDFMMKFDHLS